MLAEYGDSDKQALAIVRPLESISVHFGNFRGVF